MASGIRAKGTVIGAKTSTAPGFKPSRHFAFRALHSAFCFPPVAGFPGAWLRAGVRDGPTAFAGHFSPGCAVTGEPPKRSDEIPLHPFRAAARAADVVHPGAALADEMAEPKHTRKLVRFTDCEFIGTA